MKAAIDASLSANAQVLEKCALFAALDRPSREVLAERSHRRTYDAGEPIFRFGDAGQSMMAVLAGVVRISRPTSKGKEIILADLAAGEIIGEIAALDAKPRSADATALTNAELLVLDRRAIIPFLEAHPRVCLDLLTLVCARLRLADERMADVGFVDLPVRLAKTLLKMAPPRPASRPGYKVLAKQAELAEMIGATRESVNRQLRRWQRQGMVDLKGGWIVVADERGLEAAANAE